MRVPGAAIGNFIITPSCREVERPSLHSDPKMAALEEAFDRARRKYREHLERVDPELLERQDFRLVLTVDTDRETDDG